MTRPCSSVRAVQWRTSSPTPCLTNSGRVGAAFLTGSGPGTSAASPPPTRRTSTSPSRSLHRRRSRTREVPRATLKPAHLRTWTRPSSWQSVSCRGWIFGIRTIGMRRILRHSQCIWKARIAGLFRWSKERRGQSPAPSSFSFNPP